MWLVRCGVTLGEVLPLERPQASTWLNKVLEPGLSYIWGVAGTQAGLPIEVWRPMGRVHACMCMLKKVLVSEGTVGRYRRTEADCLR